MADPGFPRGGCANCKGGGANLLFLTIFPKNCMKLKKFGPRGGRASLAPPPWIRQWEIFEKNITNVRFVWCSVMLSRSMFISRSRLCTEIPGIRGLAWITLQLQRGLQAERSSDRNQSLVQSQTCCGLHSWVQVFALKHCEKYLENMVICFIETKGMHLGNQRRFKFC